jgi:hypothetical protein
MPEPSKTFYSGHSLGGAMMPDYVADNVADTADAMVLMGSFITRKYKTGKTEEGRPQVEFPVPTLTVGGELDGLCRISRITEALYTQVAFHEDPSFATDNLPVVVIEGMNHMQFASGAICMLWLSYTKKGLQVYLGSLLVHSGWFDESSRLKIILTVVA